MLAGLLCSFGSPWINHYQFAAARLERLDTLAHIRHGHDTAIGRHRIGAQHQKELGVIDIRNRDREHMPVHPQRYQVVGQLIDRSSGIALLGAQLP